MNLNIANFLKVIILSSLVSLITIGYVSNGYYKNNKPSKVPYNDIIIIIPILYGIMGIINYIVTSKLGINWSFIVGAIFGLLLSLVGRFVLDLPRLIFNFKKDNEYLVHIYAIMLYGCIFRFIITPITY